MPPYSYTSIKVVHDQQTEEALERARYSAEQETREHGLVQIFGAFLARFTNFLAQKPNTTFPGCNGEAERTVS